MFAICHAFSVGSPFKMGEKVSRKILHRIKLNYTHTHTHTHTHTLTLCMCVKGQQKYFRLWSPVTTAAQSIWQVGINFYTWSLGLDFPRYGLVVTDFWGISDLFLCTMSKEATGQDLVHCLLQCLQWQMMFVYERQTNVLSIYLSIFMSFKPYTKNPYWGSGIKSCHGI